MPALQGLVTSLEADARTPLAPQLPPGLNAKLKPVMLLEFPKAHEVAASKAVRPFWVWGLRFLCVLGPAYRFGARHVSHALSLWFWCVGALSPRLFWPSGHAGVAFCHRRVDDGLTYIWRRGVRPSQRVRGCAEQPAFF